MLRMISIPYTSTQKDAREKVEETFYAVSPFSAVPCSKNLCRVKPPPNSRVQVTPLERPVNRGVFGTCPVPSAVAFKNVTSGAPDADRWAALTPTCGCRTVRAVGEIAHIAVLRQL